MPPVPLWGGTRMTRDPATPLPMRTRPGAVHGARGLTCRGCSTAFCGSLFTLLLGWLVILVTGCLKMDAVCLTGRAVFRSGLPYGDMEAGMAASGLSGLSQAVGRPLPVGFGEQILCPSVTSVPRASPVSSMPIVGARWGSG